MYAFSLRNSLSFPYSSLLSYSLLILVLLSLPTFAQNALQEESSPSYDDQSTFSFAEPNIAASPQAASSLTFAQGESIVDFDVAPNRPEAVIIVKAADGKQKILFWDINNSNAKQAWDLPADLSLSAVTWHPLGAKFFISAQRGGQAEILVNELASWKPISIYKSAQTIRRLVVGPRPFETSYDESTNEMNTAYRIYFGIKKADGNFATKTITETGAREYTAFDSVTSTNNIADADVQPEPFITPSALPVGFHPAGHLLLWEDNKHCFQKANYEVSVWGGSTAAIAGKQICTGSLTYTPNGAALIHWQANGEGVNIYVDHGQKTIAAAKGFRFAATPSSVADGKGLVGLVKEGNQQRLHYVPIDVPLADVVNAWMFLESSQDLNLFSTNTGLFRQLDNDQLYQLYDTESYHCGGYDQSTPSRPYLVTTDAFWELYAASFQGIFNLSERVAAIPRFWSFINLAQAHLADTQAGSKLDKAFTALRALNSDKPTANAEAALIMQSQGSATSTVTGKPFDFGNLKPRGHYAADAEHQKYFRASKYLMDLELDEQDIDTLRKLPANINQAAQQWIAIYKPFIAPSKRPLVWGDKNIIPAYVRHPEQSAQVFPLSWGMDNEVLFSTTYHSNLPESEQIKGKNGERLLPSGLDLAAVFGSKIAETILQESGEFTNYPTLQTQLTQLKQRNTQAKNSVNDNFYSQWLNALATQWSADISSPSGTIGKNIWDKKRLQTGLASWATLRHTTLLVNERSTAECGEAGFERIVLRPPRGYVEPDPKTFGDIANLFESTITWVKQAGANWGETPAKSQELVKGVVRRLTESRDKTLLFKAIAEKEVAGKPLSNKDYEEILYVGRAVEHNFLIFKSLAQKDFALSTPDPIAKVADVAADASGRKLLVGVGKPMEWDQVVPFFGRKQIVKGPVYSYYEIASPKVLSDAEWNQQLNLLKHPHWITPLISASALSCPAKNP